MPAAQSREGGEVIQKKVLHLLSGGMDSTVLLYDLLSQHCLVHAVLFNYGQRHIQELEWAKYHCHLTKTLFTTIDLPKLRGSQLTDGSGGVVVPGRKSYYLI
jgi:7-cyano-7-deazaguanine synthase